MVITLPAHDAVTPAGKPVAAPIPVAPVVAWDILVNGVFIHNVGVDDGAPAVLSEFTVIETFDREAVHGEFDIVQVKTYVPAPPAGVKVDVGLPVSLNCAALVLGPLKTDQTPVPTVGVFAPRLADPVVQIDCGVPAFAVVGGETTVMVAVPFMNAGVQLPFTPRMVKS
jgi:hypothetical protein